MIDTNTVPILTDSFYQKQFDMKRKNEATDHCLIDVLLLILLLFISPCHLFFDLIPYSL